MIDLEKTYLSKLSRFYADLKISDFPEETVSKARRILVDFLSEVAVGHKAKKSLSPTINQYMIDLGGIEEATLLCENIRLPALSTALCLGVMGHSIELDDGHRWGTSHPAVAVIPAVLAWSEREALSFLDILSGIIVGYDLMLRTARAINPAHLKRGFHSTGTCGSLGAAASCAYLANLNAEDFSYAVSIGGLQSAGLQEMLHDHPSIKPLQPGKSASAGILSVDLVRNGAKGPRSLYEGIHGWLSAMCDNEFSESDLIGDMGNRWEIMNTYTKLYPTCRHSHASIDLAIEASQDLSISENEVSSVEIRLYDLGIREVGKIKTPISFEEAMFSLPFSIALAFRNQNVNLSSYDKSSLFDPDLLRVANLVEIIPDLEMNACYPDQRGAALKVTTNDGRIWEKSIPVAKGEPETPVNDGDYRKKLSSMLKPYFPNSFFEELWEVTVEKKETEVSYQEIINLFGRAHS